MHSDSLGQRVNEGWTYQYSRTSIDMKIGLTQIWCNASLWHKTGRDEDIKVSYPASQTFLCSLSLRSSEIPRMPFSSRCVTTVGMALGVGLGKLGMGSSAGYDLELTQT